MKRKLYFIHRDSKGFIENRFDELFMMNGSVASLASVAARLGADSLSIDEAFVLHEQGLYGLLREEIEECLLKGVLPFIFCTVFSYNAASSIALLRDLKAEYGNRIRTGVGGQLIRMAPGAYRRNTSIDHVAVGDAECTLEKLLGGDSFASGFLYNGGQTTKNGWSSYAPPRYDSYHGFTERLQEMSRGYMGPFTNMRNAVVESVRGCAWAYAMKRACEFCSIQDVAAKPHFDVRHQLEVEKHLAETWQVNWLFDVSSQWLPDLQSKERWLEAYLKERDKLGAPMLNRYAYLTANSITATTAPLLKEAGVRIAYVGIDGWDQETWSAHGKPRGVQSCLEACKKNGIFVRTSVVIGDGANYRNLLSLEQKVKEITAEFGEILISFACYLELMLPGAPVWNRFRMEAQQEGITEALEHYRKFEAVGFLSRDEEEDLTKLFMTYSPSCGVSYNEAKAVETWVSQHISNTTHAVGSSVYHCNRETTDPS